MEVVFVNQNVLSFASPYLITHKPLPLIANTFVSINNKTITLTKF